MNTVAIIGGGFAGLAAGVALAERGLAVTVLEERPHLGGRAYSFVDEESGETVDNGQHAMMGCYRHTLAFLQRIGAGAKLRRQRNLLVEMIHPRRGAGAIACPSLPSPLHVGAGLLGYAVLSPGERLAALLAGMRLMGLRRRRDARLRQQTVSAVLRDLRQTENACTSFWQPVAVATLNEVPERAAAAPFVEVLARAFFASRTDSQFVLPAVGLSDLYTGDAHRFIEARGGHIRLRARVANIDPGDGSPVAVRLAGGHTVAADACISSVPPRLLDRILAPQWKHRLGLPPLEAFETSPIVSTHLWFDRPVLTQDFVGLLGATTQWVFNRHRLTGSSRNRAAGEGGRHSQPAAGKGLESYGLSAVISAGRGVIDWQTRDIADRVHADIRSLVPAARNARLLRWIVVKEKHATISTTPAAERLRPAIRTGARRFFLAGDWVATGLPPTIESAVLSGQRAAELVLEEITGMQ
jgi:squalene-associated FAD-dependent desaturase